MAQVGHGPAFDDAPGPHDADPIAQRLHLGQDVARQQDRPSRSGDPPRCTTGTRLPSADRDRQWARRGSRVRRPRPGRRPEQPSGDSPSSRSGPSWWDPGRSAASSCSFLARSSPPRSRPSRSITSPPVRLGQSVTSPGHVGESAVEFGRVGPGIASEQTGRSPVGPNQAEKDANRGGLAGSVGAEKAVHLSSGNLEVEPVEGDRLAVSLHEAGDLDHRVCSLSRLAPLAGKRSLPYRPTAFSLLIGTTAADCQTPSAPPSRRGWPVRRRRRRRMSLPTFASCSVAPIRTTTAPPGRAPITIRVVRPDVGFDVAVDIDPPRLSDHHVELDLGERKHQRHH